MRQSGRKFKRVQKLLHHGIQLRTTTPPIALLTTTSSPTVPPRRPNRPRLASSRVNFLSTEDSMTAIGQEGQLAAIVTSSALDAANKADQLPLDSSWRNILESCFQRSV